MNRHHASASNTDKLIYCQYWASPAINYVKKTDELEDAPRFGVAFHKCCEMYLTNQKMSIKEISLKYNVEESRLRDYYKRWVEAITSFLKKRNWEHRLKIVEQKIAIDVYKDSARFLKNPKERDYSECRRTELPGTADLVLAPEYGKPFVVIDWKSGQSSYDANKNGQLKTLSLGFSRHYKLYQASTMIIRIDDDFIELSEGSIDSKQLNNHRNLLRSKLDLAMTSNPPMRIGHDCNYCDAIEVCPAHQQPFSLADVRVMDEEQVSNLYEKIIPAEKLLQKKRQLIKDYIKSNGPIKLNSGKWLQIKSYEEENLSKASIKRVLGVVEGEELIEKLREMKIIERSIEERLVPLVDPCGRK